MQLHGLLADEAGSLGNHDLAADRARRRSFRSGEAQRSAAR